ncbi:MAG TPA: squalene/phytoene synthase family protein [Solirubrobacteraceae bacterium]|nr:squalene/phytoene synthase family protein [Solirubrobacteraceae bacterium]
MSDAAAVAEAYRHCEAITRREAANFHYGVRLLDHRRRQGMSAVYAFARRVDDIGDGTLPAAEKLLLLDGESQALAALEAGSAPPGEDDLVLVALADTHTRFALPAGALGELIEGVRMDVRGVEYETFDELVVYCRRVAGAIGRVCLAVFGLRAGAGNPARAHALADDLGVALQITNILRDVREDAENGRVYLPAEDLRRFGITGAADGDAGAARRIASLALSAAEESAAAAATQELARMSELVRFEAARGREWFVRGTTLAGLLDRRSAACLMAMAGIYRRLLDRIEEDPPSALARRVSLPRSEKIIVAARGMIGAGA